MEIAEGFHNVVVCPQREAKILDSVLVDNGFIRANFHCLFVVLASISAMTSIALTSSNQIKAPNISSKLAESIISQVQCRVEGAPATHSSAFEYMQHCVLKIYPFLCFCSVAVHFVQCFVMLTSIDSKVQLHTRSKRSVCNT